jgi:hypothetical protein
MLGCKEGTDEGRQTLNCAAKCDPGNRPAKRRLRDQSSARAAADGALWNQWLHKSS